MNGHAKHQKRRGNAFVRGRGGGEVMFFQDPCRPCHCPLPIGPCPSCVEAVPLRCLPFDPPLPPSVPHRTSRVAWALGLYRRTLTQAEVSPGLCWGTVPQQHACLRGSSCAVPQRRACDLHSSPSRSLFQNSLPLSSWPSCLGRACPCLAPPPKLRRLCRGPSPSANPCVAHVFRCASSPIPGDFSFH